MKLYMPTCNALDHLLPGTAWLFNKYWSPDQEVIVCGDRPPEGLPANFSFRTRASEPWAHALRPIIEAESDPYFGLLLDDYWIYDSVNLPIVEELKGMLDRNEIKKGDLSNNTIGLGAEPFNGHPKFWVAKQMATYRSSTQAAIWSKGYLMKLLKPDRNIWQFEIVGIGETCNDGANIAAYESTVCNYANIYYKGAIVNWQVDKLKAEDIQAMWDANICRDVLAYSAYIVKKGK